MAVMGNVSGTGAVYLAAHYEAIYANPDTELATELNLDKLDHTDKAITDNIAAVMGGKARWMFIHTS